MQKRSGLVVVSILLVSLMIVSFVSAGLFDSFKVTGQAAGDIILANEDPDLSQTTTVTQGAGLDEDLLKGLFVYYNGEPVTISRKADIWRDTDVMEISIKNPGKLKSLSLGNKFLFDTDPTNNTWER